MPKMTLHIGANISGLQSALGKAKNMITGWAGALGGALSAAGLAMFAKKAIDAADAVADGSKKLGISAESYQKLSYAAEQSGASMDSVATAFKKMSSTISDAMAGNKTAIDSLAKLGVSIDDLKGKSPDQQFAIIADALNSVTNATDKAAYAQDVFGKSGTELTAMIANYKDLGDELETASGLMSNEAVEAANKFNDAINTLSKSLTSGLVNSGLVQWLADVAEGINGVVSNANKLGGKTGIFGKGNSSAYGANGATGGFFSNLKDAYFGESEGQKLTTVDTAAEKAKLEANKKKFEETGKTTAERKSEKQENAERIKHQAAALKQAEEEAKAYEKRMNLEGKQNQSVKDSIKALDEKIAKQKLINEGKLREAAIQEAINDAESDAGRSLTAEEYDAISSRAGSLYDQTHKVKTKTVDMVAPAVSDAVQRIGGSIGNAQNTGKQQVDLLKMISDGIKSLDQKTTYDVGGGTSVWP